jgi:hypothetical protein
MLLGQVAHEAVQSDKVGFPAARDRAG